MIPEQHVVGWKCDICGMSCNASQDERYEAHERASLRARWGYHSRKDMQVHECDMCEDCYDHLVEYIETMGGKVRVIEDNHFDPLGFQRSRKEGVDYVLMGELPGSAG
jgi:hypothetical protein